MQKGKLTVAAVLSGNRNFEGRINPLVHANYLASPPLVVAYALAGRVDIDLQTEPLGSDQNGKDVYLNDIWPTTEEVAIRRRNARSAPKCSRRNIRKSFRATPAGTRSRFRPAISTTGTTNPPTSASRPTSTTWWIPKTSVAGSHRPARARDAGRFRHHRSHLARRQHSRRQSGRKIS